MNCYKTPTRRSANVLNADTVVYAHPTNPLRRVVARNAKQSLGDGRYAIVRVFAVRAKQGTRWVSETPGTSKERAERVFGASIPDCK